MASTVDTTSEALYAATRRSSMALAWPSLGAIALPSVLG
jgi:hypothetical protein